MNRPIRSVAADMMEKSRGANQYYRALTWRAKRRTKPVLTRDTKTIRMG
jgi:hypothetical protein